MENGYEYVVKEGDTLSEILYNMTGNGSKELYDKVAMENNIDNANLIVPGQTIVISQDLIQNNTNSVTSSPASNLDNVIQENTNTSSFNETVTTQTPKTDKANKEEIVRAESDKNYSNIFETTDQSEFEELLSKKRTTDITKNETNTSKNTLDRSKNQPASTRQNTQDQVNNSTQQSSTSNTETNSVYIPSDYEICNPQSVSGFDPRNSFLTFQIKANAGEHFVAVNNKVKKCGEDIDGIISSLTTLKLKMGENTGTVSQIDKIIEALGQKKQDLITKNSELIEACNKVIEYVYENKSSKASAASKVYNTIAQINIYKG